MRLNQRGRTNMLESVTNPLGGQIRLDYERTGNTVDQPGVALGHVDVEFDDGRAGDGPDVQPRRTTTTATSRTRCCATLGFTSISRGAGQREPATLLRRFERDLPQRQPVGDAALLIKERLFEHPAGGQVLAGARPSTGSWSTPTRTARRIRTAPTASPVDEPAGGRHTRARTAAVRHGAVTAAGLRALTQYDAQRATSRCSRPAYTYNVIGDVLTVLDRTKPRSTATTRHRHHLLRLCADRGGDRRWVRRQWISVPQTVTVYAGNDARASGSKFRDGGPDLCVNSVPLRIAELVRRGRTPAAATCTRSPSCRSTRGALRRGACPSTPSRRRARLPGRERAGDRSAARRLDQSREEDDRDAYCVDYVYDDHPLTDIADVTDNHGVSSHATYEPLNGRLADATDENGNVTTYSYDAPADSRRSPHHASRAPARRRSPTPTAALDATLNPTGTPMLGDDVHHDGFNRRQPDRHRHVRRRHGPRRATQARRRRSTASPVEARIVEGAIEFDALGREVKEWYPDRRAGRRPTADHLQHAQLSERPGGDDRAGDRADRATYDVFDRMAARRCPTSRKETAYDYRVRRRSRRVRRHPDDDVEA